MWLALRVLLWLDDGMNVLTCFIILLFVAYCAAGLAALEPRHTLPGHLVQWLCTGWGARQVLLQGPLKIFGGLFLLPFAASVIAAQIWLRTVAFIVWLSVAWPCCRLNRDDNVYDAFEREVALPLLQCSFLAYACTLSALILGGDQLSKMQRMAVCSAAVYYTGMLMLWTAPAVMRAKVAAEESFDTSGLLGEEGSAQLLERRSSVVESDAEMEDIRSKCDELRALLQRERHDKSIEIGQLNAKLRDQELRTRAAERERDQVKMDSSRLTVEVKEWREKCMELGRLLGERLPQRPALPRIQWPAEQESPEALGPSGGPALAASFAMHARPDRCLSEETSGDSIESDEERTRDHGAREGMRTRGRDNEPTPDTSPTGADSNAVFATSDAVATVSAFLREDGIMEAVLPTKLFVDQSGSHAEVTPEPVLEAVPDRPPEQSSADVANEENVAELEVAQAALAPAFAPPPPPPVELVDGQADETEVSEEALDGDASGFATPPESASELSSPHSGSNTHVITEQM